MKHPTTTAIDLDARVQVPEHVMHRAFDTETVLLNLRTGLYHGIDPLGARMLEALETGGSVRAAAAALAGTEGREPTELEEVLERFCTRLAERDLLRIDGG